MRDKRAHAASDSQTAHKQRYPTDVIKMHYDGIVPRHTVDKWRIGRRRQTEDVRRCILLRLAQLIHHS